MWKKIKPYLVGIALPLAVGGLAALWTKDSMEMYKTVVKPDLAPPGVVFPIVWSILFVLMGVSSVLVYKSDGSPKAKKTALWLYGLQLGVNFFWNPIFFNLQAFLFALIWLVLLWILVLAMIVSFYRVHKPAAYLQIPYLLWVTFAGYLNWMIYTLNP